MKRKLGVSSRDVAKEAGVSQATVSYVLNDVKNISIKQETREAVFNAVKKLNYHPNQIARGMKLNKSMSIGVVTDRNVTNLYFMKTLEGIKDGVQPYNYSITLLFDKADEVTGRESLKYYSSNRLDGIIFAFSNIDELTVNYLNEKNIPYVVVDAEASGFEAFEVCSDWLSHMGEVIEFFVNKGIKKIGYAGPIQKNMDRRLLNYKNALKAQGLELLENYIAQSDFVDSEIELAIDKLLTQAELPQAIIATSPKFAMLTVRGAQRKGLRVPEDLKVIALGTSNYYSIANPKVSAVELPLYEMGFKASQMLFNIIDGKQVEKTVILPSELVIRESS